MQPIIRVENLGKQYRVGRRGATYATLRETLVGAVRTSVDRFRRCFERRGEGGGSSGADLFWALRDVNFAVHPGEVVGVIGRNGAGKSTLLKILSRITEPTTGRIDLYGRVGSLLEVGSGFHPELTGRENIFLNGAIMGMKRAQIVRNFDEIVAFAEVEKFIDTPVKRYSSGMYTRLAFAVAAHLDPEVLIVDEVLAVGDAQFQKKCLGKMGEFANNGRTVIFVSHHLGTINRLCRRAVWLEAGEIRAVGEARKIVASYLSDASKVDQAFIDLDACLQRIDPDPRVRLTSLEWETGLPLCFGDTVRLTVRMTARVPVDEIAVGIGFSMIEGQRFLTIDSDLAAGRVRIGPGGERAFTLTIGEFPVSPGTYAVDLGVRSGDGATLDYLPEVCRVEVIPSEDTPSNIMRFPNVGVRIPGLWSWTDGKTAATGMGVR